MPKTRRKQNNLSNKMNHQSPPTRNMMTRGQLKKIKGSFQTSASVLRQREEVDVLCVDKGTDGHFYVLIKKKDSDEEELLTNEDAKEQHEQPLVKYYQDVWDHILTEEQKLKLAPPPGQS